MRQLSQGLADHLERQATTMASAWRVTRRDGVVFGFTDHDADLAFDGTMFSAVSGFAASDIEAELGLSVDSGEVEGAFSSAAITEKALREGRFDGAKVETFAVNWAAPGDHVLLRVHEIGEVSFAGEAFRAELRSLTSRLDRVDGRVYGRRCDADLGDGRCRVDLDDPVYRGEGAVVVASDRTAISADGLAGFAGGWFSQGVLVWTSGPNEGLRVEILNHRAGEGGVRLTFWAPVANLPHPGDTFTVTAGCAKSFNICREKFGNGLNFQGFPHLPGSDFAYGYANGEAQHDGRPVVA